VLPVKNSIANVVKSYTQGASRPWRTSFIKSRKNTSVNV